MAVEFPPRPTWADIDLNALLHNLRQAQRFFQPHQRALTVVKADAYGHGAVPVARCFQRAGVCDFAVATLEEAIELRDAGIDDALLVLGGCHPGQEKAFMAYNLMPALLDPQMALRLSAAAEQQGCRIPAHLKIDSGMGRVGFLPNLLRDFLPQLQQLKGLEIVGLMSHLACADELDSGVTLQQLERFRSVRQMLRDGGIVPRDIHISNSAGLSGWDVPEATLMRPGIMLYGGLPGPDFDDKLELRPVMHLRSCISQLRTLPKGSGVSYGHNFYTERDTRVAVLPIGYADGYNRLWSNRGQGILHGQKIPLIGRVCMDWIMFDVTDVPQAKVGDSITLLGFSEGLSILGDFWAEQLDTISYEVFCRIGSRVPRRYLGGPV
ncbi:alanine racemase [Malonomonas rubra DSM 5091]|uniref:Alanine racemase n=1 Tax=Malonomonas rubra DSM 5091 TaxID=1122189 RepID=A0A1M6E8Q9_MALRU|nr:alanine racemase [Malonomonas rubra]SHI81842.1 alanine racemase [Malonomonas rubra DSM 5091]